MGGGVLTQALMRLQSRCQVDLQSTEGLTAARVSSFQTLMWLLVRVLVHLHTGFSASTNFGASLQHGGWVKGTSMVNDRIIKAFHL